MLYALSRELSSAQLDLDYLPNVPDMKKNNKSPTISLLTILSLLLTMCGGMLLPSLSASAQSTNRVNDGSTAKRSTYVDNLTDLARNGQLEAKTQVNAVMPQLVKILSGDQHVSPVLIGEYELTSRSVAENLAQQIATSKVPALREIQVFSLNGPAFFNGARTQEELARRTTAVLNEVGRSPKSVLFLGQLHQFVGKRAVIRYHNLFRKRLPRAPFVFPDPLREPTSMDISQTMRILISYSSKSRSTNSLRVRTPPLRQVSPATSSHLKSNN
jgi:hypothetical protein